MTADAIAASPHLYLSPDDPRAMLPIDEVAVLLDVSVPTLKRLHFADPVAYPAERVGTLWRIPRWWVEQKIACGLPVTKSAPGAVNTGSAARSHLIAKDELR